MLKQFLNGGSLKSLMLFDGNNDDGSDPKAKLREQIAKGNLPTALNDETPPADDANDEGGEDGDDESGDEKPEEDNVIPEEETEEQKVAREAKEKETAKLQRKQDRMQRRIDEAIAAKKSAEDRIRALEAQLAADPDKTLTAEEIKRQAEAIAKEQIAAKELEDLKKAFDADCDRLQKEANKIDKDFTDKIYDIAEQFGPIPSFMIGVLKDLDNGAEVLAFVANDDDVAETLWKASPAKMTKQLVDISNKMIEAKKKPKKEISKVPDPGEPVRGSRSTSTAITPADAKNMDVWTKKRFAQMEEKRKARGF